jgi:predicted metal-dependent phosphoesterase TrpH
MSTGVRLDLHVHSQHSPDSRLTLDAIAAQLPFAGLKGFALTDHNSVSGHRAIPRLRESYPGILILPGVEVSTREGHLLVYGVTAVPPVHRTLAETLDWVRDHGGEPVLAHPFRLAHGAGRRVAETAAVRGLETRNGHNSEVQNYRAELLAARRGLTTTGGSDVHELAELGRAYTEFPSDAASEDDLLDALRRSRVEPGGHSLRWTGRFRLGLRTGALLLARGFRPI